jgi:hypothetical protein
MLMPLWVCWRGGLDWRRDATDLVVVEVLVVSEVDEGVLVGPVADSRLMLGAHTCTR